MKTPIAPRATIILSAFAIFGQCLIAQTQARPRTKPQTPVLGYVDPATGKFHLATPESTPDADIAATVAPTTGKLVFSFIIRIASSVPSSDAIVCVADSTALERPTATNPRAVYLEEASAVGSRSGSTATCTVSIPYSWLLATPASDTLTLHYAVGAGTSTAVAINVARKSAHQLPVTKVPATGATTTATFNVTI